MEKEGTEALSLTFTIEGEFTIGSPFNGDSVPEMTHQSTIIVVYDLFDKLPADLRSLRPYVSSAIYKSILDCLTADPFYSHHHYKPGSNKKLSLSFWLPCSVTKNNYVTKLPGNKSELSSRAQGSQQLMTKNFLLIELSYELSMIVSNSQPDNSALKMTMEPHCSWWDLFQKADQNSGSYYDYAHAKNLEPRSLARVLSGLHTFQL